MNSNTSFEISASRIQATQFTGLLPVVNFLRTDDFIKPFFDAVRKAVPLKHNAHFSAELMTMQRLLAMIAGFEDLNDHDVLRDEPGFQAAMQTADLARSSTLCRFENRFERVGIDAVNSAIFECFCIANYEHKLLRSPKPGRKTCLFLDVDSTHVDLYGNQEQKSYNAHYKTNCLAPCLCYLDRWPVAVFNAPGTMDARKVLEPQLRRLLRRIMDAFPEYRIVLRADAGFNSKVLIGICDDLGVDYVTGLSPNKKAQKAALTGISQPVIKKVKRFTTAGEAWRKIGELTNYQAKGWTRKRRIVARKQHDPRTNQMDLRLIQTSIKYVSDPKAEGYCGELSAMDSEQLYETVYCGRGRMEQDIGEFKTDCFGARASATKFHTNSFRMILAMMTQLICKVLRRILWRHIKEEDGRDKEKEMGMTKFRQRVIWVISQIRYVKKTGKTLLTLPEFMLDEQAFLLFFKLRMQ